MTVIFRVQDNNGRGPFKPGFSRQWVEERADHENLRPWYEEFGRVDQRAIVGMAVGCGCRELEQLRRWFTAIEYAELQKFGYCAVRMKVGRVLGESDIQCVFERAIPLHKDTEPVQLYAPNAALTGSEGVRVEGIVMQQTEE